jgi:hypothetical protein
MLAGVLVDVSGSMEMSLQLDVKPTDQHLTRAESIFNTIIKIAEREVTYNDNQEIFVIAFGLKDYSICDLLTLLENPTMLNNNNSYNDTDGYDRLIQLLKDNGAPHAREYVIKHLKEGEAGFLYNFYSKNISKLRELVDELPDACKDNLGGTFTRGVKVVDIFGFTSKREKEVTREHANHAIEKAKAIIRKQFEEMLRPKRKTVKATIDLLHRVAGKSSSSSSSSSSSKDKSLSAKQLTNLVSSIEPYIYGDTPMCEALRTALDMFRPSTHDHKVLFLLTDGEATDGDPVKLAKNLDDNNIQVFVCLISSDKIPHPRRLYYEPDPNWTKEQLDMFKLSSPVENTHSAMSVLLEHGWELPASGQSRLFLQANHPDVIDEFSSLVRHVTESNDALLNIFGRVSLDKYINSANSTFEPKTQKGGTCYANAVAAVLHLAMNRIEGREGGVPEFFKLREELIKVYGERGANTAYLLNKWTPKYRLKYGMVDELGARQAINARRPVVAIFSLYEQQWTAFSKFYKDNPQGILERKDLGTHRSLTDLCGHAVVLIKCDPKSLTFMNSWGTAFADGGFFKVRNQSVLDLEFYDVYWTLSDLKESEIKAFDQKRRKVGEDFVRNLPVNVQNLPYECPRCQRSSPAIMFIGHLLEATCPKCKQNFKPTPLGLVLNSYTH